MQSVIEELYLAYVEQAAIDLKEQPALLQAVQERKNNFVKLWEALSDAEKELFDKYIDAQTDMEGIQRYDTYRHALKFGAQFMSEVFISL